MTDGFLLKEPGSFLPSPKAFFLALIVLDQIPQGR